MESIGTLDLLHRDSCYRKGATKKVNWLGDAKCTQPCPTYAILGHAKEPLIAPGVQPS